MLYNCYIKFFIGAFADRDFLVQHAVFTEHSTISSSPHQCPYMAYYGPVHSSSSSSVGSVSDGSSFGNRWGGPSGASEIPTSYTFAAMDPHYHGWEHHSQSFPANGSHLGASDQTSAPSLTTRSSRMNSDIPRSGSFVHPFVISHRYALTAVSISTCTYLCYIRRINFSFPSFHL